ncbi:MAG: M1 family metallopeptidase [Cytophagales bacterium]|nr:M1 family metallopeptidase [Cytophagales bacterium]
MKISKDMEIYSNDPHSYSRPEEAVTEHIDLDLKVDFKSKLIAGTATLTISKKPGVNRIFLDTKDLRILDVKNDLGESLKYKLGEEDSILGAALTIDLNGHERKISIRYTTGEQAEALQWLNPEQTADKTDPFLFSQSQAILARSWIPLQDSPGIRCTYNAKVEVPKGMMALMSAENPQEINDSGIYHFSMPQPIPSYLMALAVGKVEFARIGDRTGVYAEPGMLKRSVEEFSEMEDMLMIAEQLYGPYQWGRYDLIVLPPSFPFGGMENPRITFATPTILAGDKSLTSLVAHELAHSWSGNLVTNATWNDFWLNEGFTVYFEYRIMEALKGRDYAEMLSSLSLQGLLDEVDLFMKSGKENATKLKLDLAGANPDDGVTAIAYDKGYFFLRRLEEYVGREKFDEFLNLYFSKHAFKSNHTEAFLVFLKEHLFEKNEIKPIEDLNEWVYDSGLPSSLPAVDSKRFKRVDAAISQWIQNDYAFDVSNWSSHEWVHFIKNLPKDLSAESMQKLDEKFDFTNSGNAEILGVWFVHCSRKLYEPSLEAMSNFLIRTGRRKFLMPVYEELVKSGEGRKIAKEIYAKARPNYHFVASSSLDRLLK